MVVPSPTCTDKVRDLDVPVIDLSWRRDVIRELVLKACEEFGLFRVINHGIARNLVSSVEGRVEEFFALPMAEKQRSGPPNPLGYGSRHIGFSGDTGELEYLILHTGPGMIAQKAKTVWMSDPVQFSSPVNEYVDAMKDLAAHILDILGEALDLQDSKTFSKLIQNRESDSLIRLNHYPARFNGIKDGSNVRVDFGEHSDPQLLSILRSNDVQGLQILKSNEDGGVWVPVPADPEAFFVSVGDLLQAMTNGSLLSVRHRVIASSHRSRFSMVFFAGPPLHTSIVPLPEMITSQIPPRYKAFTWAEYKKAMYTLRLGYNRLDLYRADEEEERATCV